METKRCKKCNKIKQNSKFKSSDKNPDGLKNNCVDCTKKLNYHKQNLSIQEADLLKFLTKFKTTTGKYDWTRIIDFADIDIVDYLSLWQAWEYLIECSVRILEPDYLLHYSNFPNEVRAVITIPSKKLIIDAATSNYATKLKHDYYQNIINDGYIIEFWCLYRTDSKPQNENNISYLFVDELINRLKPYRETKLIEKIEQVHNKFLDFQTEILSNTSNYSNLKLLEFIETFERPSPVFNLTNY